MSEQQSAAISTPGRHHPGGLVALVLIAAAGALVNYRFHPYVMDDAFITYRYAQNFAAGAGLVFNPGERVLGTSSPLYALLLGALAKLGVAPHVGSSVIFCAALGGIALLGGWWLRTLGAPRAAWLFAALVASGFGGVRLYFGLETPLYTLLLLLALAAASACRPRLAGCWCGLAFLARHDAAVFALLLFAWWWWRHRRLPWLPAAAAAAVVAPWLLFAQLYYGSIFPNTLGAKAGENPFFVHLSGSAGEQARRAFEHLRHYSVVRLPEVVALGLVLLLFGLLFAGARRAIRRDPAVALALLFPFALWLAYGAIGPPVEHNWHLLPAAYLLLWVGVAAGAEAWAGAPRWLASPACAGGALLLLLLLPARVREELAYHQDSPFYRSRTDTYRQMAEWIGRVGLRDLRVLTHEPGYFAYLGRMPVIDGAGLVTRGARFHGPRGQRDSVEALIERFAPEAVLPLGGYPPAWFFAGYVPTVTGFPARSVQVRADVLAARWPAVVAALAAAPPFDPSPGTPPLVPPFEFDFNTQAGWDTFRERGGIPGEPYRRAIDGRSPPDARVVASTSPLHSTVEGIESPTLRLDCDELAFSWGGNDDVMTVVQLVVDGVVVLQRNGRSGSRVLLREELWPLWPWRGRLGVLRLTDNGSDGRRAVLGRMRCLRHQRLEQLDDFEDDQSSGWSDLWVSTFGERPAETGALAVSSGLGLRLGEGVASSLGRGGEQELRSRPFRVLHDWLGFYLLDFGGDQTGARLLVDGEPWVEIRGTGTNRLRPIMWDLTPLRGRLVELAVSDRDGRPERGIGIDEIHVFDRPEG